MRGVALALVALVSWLAGRKQGQIEGQTTALGLAARVFAGGIATGRRKDGEL